MSLKEQIIMLLEAGKKNEEICRLCKCSIQYVQDIRKSSGYVLNHPTIENSRYSKSYSEWFSREWDSAVERVRRCFK